MEKKTYSNLDLDIYEEVLDNGLKVFLCPMDRHVVYAQMTTFFGGGVLEFKVPGEDDYTKVPAGVAHFLEHKMFEKEDGEDPITSYEKRGSSGNAFTSQDITAYHFTGTDNFFENLATLLKTVHEPYFTDENVLKEKGIISQEKKQSMDNPSSIVYDKCLYNTFKNLDFKNSVLGSLEDINSITKDDLYKCYNTFYHPSNMVLTISGGIDKDETIKFIRDYYEKHHYDKIDKILIREKEEPLEVAKSFETVYKENETKEIFIIYKIKNNHFIKDDYLNNVYMSGLLDMKFGSLSDFSEIVYKDDNILSDVYSGFRNTGDFVLFSFGVTVKDDTKKIIDLIDKTIKDDNFDENNFNLIKKNILNEMILLTEKPGSICSSIVSQVRLYGNVRYDMYDCIKGLEFDKFKDVYNNLNFDNKAIVILENKK